MSPEKNSSKKEEKRKKKKDYIQSSNEVGLFVRASTCTSSWSVTQIFFGWAVAFIHNI